MESIKKLSSIVIDTVTDAVTDALTQSTDAPLLSAEDGAVIFGLVLCVLFGFVLSFFILSKIKRK